MVSTGQNEAWPPSTKVAQADVARLIIERLRHEFRLGWVNQTGANLIDGRWVAKVGIWPCDGAATETVRAALAPMEVETFPHQVARAFTKS